MKNVILLILCIFLFVLVVLQLVFISTSYCSDESHYILFQNIYRSGPWGPVETIAVSTHGNYSLCREYEEKYQRIVDTENPEMWSRENWTIGGKLFIQYECNKMNEPYNPSGKIVFYLDETK